MSCITPYYHPIFFLSLNFSFETIMDPQEVAECRESPPTPLSCFPDKDVTLNYIKTKKPVLVKKY